MIRWQDTLSQNGMPWEAGGFGLADGYGMESLEGLKAFLDAVHIRMCLVRPYQNLANYPLVEPRELLPSFDNAMFEYKELPGFSMLASFPFSGNAFSTISCTPQRSRPTPVFWKSRSLPATCKPFSPGCHVCIRMYSDSSLRKRI